jgi:hypothetical protein
MQYWGQIMSTPKEQARPECPGDGDCREFGGSAVSEWIDFGGAG